MVVRQVGNLFELQEVLVRRLLLHDGAAEAVVVVMVVLIVVVVAVMVVVVVMVVVLAMVVVVVEEQCFCKRCEGIGGWEITWCCWCLLALFDVGNER